MATANKYPKVKWNQLRRGSKVLHRGQIRTVVIIDKPNYYNSIPKITFDKGCTCVILFTTRFIRVSY